MARCYSVLVPNRQSSVPPLWLVSDARNDAAVERSLKRLPRGSGLVFRHYHLPPHERRARFEVLARLARRFGHVVVLAGDAREARAWGAHGAYGTSQRLGRGPAVLRLVTVHSLRELAQAQRRQADAVVLSPVFATASHPGGRVLGPVRWKLLAARALVPTIALGGMTAHRAQAYGIAKWAAIDGLS